MQLNNKRVLIKPEISEELPEREASSWDKPEHKKGKSVVSRLLIDNVLQLMETRKRYLEIGSFDGVTISCFAEKYPDKQFYAVDAFEDHGWSNTGCKEYFIMNNFDFDNVFLYHGRSQEIIFEWVKTNSMDKFDIVFVDGDHSFEGSLVDICLAWHLLNENGVMIIHDTNVPHFGCTYSSVMFASIVGRKMVHYNGEGGFIFK